MDPVNYPVRPVLEFIQERLTTAMALTTFKVYVALISASHTPLEGSSVGMHPLLSQFLQGARWLRTICQSLVPSWDLTLVLGALTETLLSPWNQSQTKCLISK